MGNGISLDAKNNLSLGMWKCKSTFQPKLIHIFLRCRPKFRGEVEMPVVLGSDDPAHNVTILDQAGKAIEWNGEVGGWVGW